MPAEDTRISVVTAVLNGADRLQRCLDSVASQDWPNVELVVMDGGSRDGAIEVIRANEPLISHWESQPDRGIYHAWNKALDKLTGTWIQFLGSDDQYAAPDVLSRVAKRLRTCGSGVRIMYGSIAVVSSEGEAVQVVGQPWEQAKARMKIGMLIPFPGAFMHRSLFEEYGKFNESFAISGDYEFLLRSLTTGSALFLDDLLVVLMTDGGKSSSRNYRLTRCFEDARARRLHGLFPYPAAWCWETAKVCLYRGFEEVLGEQAALSAQRAWRRLP